MSTIPLTQGKVALVDDADYDWLMQWKWSASIAPANAYALRRRRNAEPRGPSTILMHRALLSAPDYLEVDHINGNGLDNRRKNLRLATRTLNCRNKHRRRSTRAGLPMGVLRAWWGGKDCGYMARIRQNYRQHHLGTFRTPEEAAAAYELARKQSIKESEAMV